MRSVKGKDTAPEMLVRKYLFSLGLRYRLHSKDIPGKPDIVFKKYKKAIFINGCFWHGHSCKRGNRIPVNNQNYWLAKISRNKDRDIKNQHLLTDMGWGVLVVWECEISDRGELISRLDRFIRG